MAAPPSAPQAPHPEPPPGADSGAVTRTEFTRFLSTLGGPGRDADSAFDLLDTDQDGRITRADCVAAWEDYLLNDAPDRVGLRVFTGL